MKKLLTVILSVFTLGLLTGCNLGANKPADKKTVCNTWIDTNESTPYTYQLDKDGKISISGYVDVFILNGPFSASGSYTTNGNTINIEFDKESVYLSGVNISPSTIDALLSSKMMPFQLSMSFTYNFENDNLILTNEEGTKTFAPKTEISGTWTALQVAKNNPRFSVDEQLVILGNKMSYSAGTKGTVVSTKNSFSYTATKIQGLENPTAEALESASFSYGYERMGNLLLIKDDSSKIIAIFEELDTKLYKEVKAEDFIGTLNLFDVNNGALFAYNLYSDNSFEYSNIIFGDTVKYRGIWEYSYDDDEGYYSLFLFAKEMTNKYGEWQDSSSTTLALRDITINQNVIQGSHRSNDNPCILYKK